MSNSTDASTAISYQSNELLVILNRFKSEQASGIYSFTVNVPNTQRSRTRLLVFNGGQLCYAAETLPEPEQFVEYLGTQLNIPNLKMGIKMTTDRIKNKSSIRELLSLMVNMSIFTWEKVEIVCLRDTLCALEQIFKYSGSYKREDGLNFDLTFAVEEKGLQWKNIFQGLNTRQKTWLRLKDSISDLDAIPCVVQDLPAEQNLTKEFQQARALLDGVRTLSEIANAFKMDHLKFANYCYSWKQSGWIFFKGEVPDNQDTQRFPDVSVAQGERGASQSQKRSTVLCVDDSPIVRTMLKRALGEFYEVELASSGTEALATLNDLDVSIVLLDVTMPDMDGYEVCRLIRKIDRFKTLPVVMITAKDSMFDRVKGKLAGTDRYLTKPISPNKVLATVAEFVEM
ncbi:MAG: response regulator [Cyanobacteria bacterium P01_E01_bin.45]